MTFAQERPPAEEAGSQSHPGGQSLGGDRPQYACPACRFQVAHRCPERDGAVRVLREVAE